MRVTWKLGSRWSYTLPCGETRSGFASATEASRHGKAHSYALRAIDRANEGRMTFADERLESRGELCDRIPPKPTKHKRQRGFRGIKSLGFSGMASAARGEGKVE